MPTSDFNPWESNTNNKFEPTNTPQTTVILKKKVNFFNYIELKERSIVIRNLNQNTSIEELERLSMAITSNPTLCNSTTVCEPIKPMPPVTNIFIFFEIIENKK